MYEKKKKRKKITSVIALPPNSVLRNFSDGSRSRGGKRGGKKNRDKSRGGAIEPGASFSRACRLCLNGGVLVAMVTFMGVGEALRDLEARCSCERAKIERDEDKQAVGKGDIWDEKPIVSLSSSSFVIVVGKRNFGPRTCPLPSPSYFTLRLSFCHPWHFSSSKLAFFHPFVSVSSSRFFYLVDCRLL